MNNDTMVEELAELIENFLGAANQTRCFTHILNLVIKSILHQFDVPKAKAGVALDAATWELQSLGKDLDREETIYRLDVEEEDDAEEDDNVQGWVNELNEMSQEELDELDASVQPVRFALTKVSHVNVSHCHQLIEFGLMSSFENLHSPLSIHPL